MILHKGNCSNPLFWGKELVYKTDNNLVVSEQGFSVSDDFDFLNYYFGNFWPLAKEYYGKYIE